MNDPTLSPLLDALQSVPGLKAIVLGGSRGRGTHGPASDYDIGLYYESDCPFDVAVIQAAILPLLDDQSMAVTEIGAWGPWIDGGGWLTIAGVEVDLLYRDLARVHNVIEEARQGHFSMNYQVGHPHGFPSVIYMGEIATCQTLFDPFGRVAELKKLTDPYPRPLQETLVSRFGWEMGFAIENAELAVKRKEQTHIAGCAYRALCCLGQVLFAVNERYLINEKGALPEAATFPATIPHLAEMTTEIWSDIGNSNYARALARLQDLKENMTSIVTS